LVVGLLAAFGFTALASAQEGTPPSTTPTTPYAGRGWLSQYHDQIKAAVADALGLTVEELDAARAEGKRLPQIVEEQGLTLEDVQADLLAAYKDILAQAVADGVLTQAQADLIEQGLENGRGLGFGLKGFAGPRGGWLSEYRDDLKSAFADELGVSVEELDAAWLAAHQSVLAQAVADGAITQAQADAIAERLANGDGFNFGFGFGRGGHGPGFGPGRGGFGPGRGGFGFFDPNPDNTTPATPSDSNES
jgi:hypothetical protein